MSEGYSINDFKQSIHVFEGEHSPWGPSSGKRWINCPGSVNATKDIADPGSEWAAEGTVAHTISELCRKRGVFAKDFLNYKVTCGQHAFTIDNEFAVSVQEFIDWCNEVPGKILIEQKVHYPDYVPNGFGTLDDGRLDEPTVVLTDFKHGKGVQEFAKENEQLMLQGLGVLYDYGHIYTIDGFLLRICQPRLDHKDKWYISVADLLAWAKRTIPEAYQRTLLGRDFKAGPWCRFCRIKKTCAVRANMALQTVTGTTFDAITDDVKPSKIVLEPNDLAKLAPLLAPIKQWCKDVESAIVAALTQGKKAGDCKMVEGRSTRRWEGLPEQVAGYIKQAGLEPYAPQELRSVANVEEEVGKKRFKELFPEGERWKKPPGKPKLAWGDDPRKPMSREVLTQFTSLEDEDDG